MKNTTIFLIILLFSLSMFFLISEGVVASKIGHFDSYDSVSGYINPENMVDNDTGTYSSSSSGTNYIELDSNTFSGSGTINWVHISVYCGGKELDIQVTPRTGLGWGDEHTITAGSQEWETVDITNDSNMISSASDANDISVWVNTTLYGHGNSAKIHAVQIEVSTITVTDVWVDDDASSAWYDNPAHFDNLADAVAAVGTDDTVYIYDGEYEADNLSVDHMTIRGNSSSTVTINNATSEDTLFTTYLTDFYNLSLYGHGNSAKPIVRQIDNDCTFTNIYFKNENKSADVDAIRLKDGKVSLEIENCTFDGKYTVGVLAPATRFLYIRNSTFNTEQCIKGNRFIDTEIQHNEFNLVSSESTIINISDVGTSGDNILISNNTFSDGGSKDHHIIFNGNPVCFCGNNFSTDDELFIYFEDYESSLYGEMNFSCNDMYFTNLKIDNVSTMRIVNNTADYMNYFCRIVDSSEIILRNNTMTDCLNTLDVVNSENITFENSWSYGENIGSEYNADGFNIDSSNNITVANSTLDNMSYDSFELRGTCTNINIINNTYLGSIKSANFIDSYGFSDDTSTSLLVANNTCHNVDIFVGLHHPTNVVNGSVNITDNDIYDVDYGIELDDFYYNITSNNITSNDRAIDIVGNSTGMAANNFLHSQGKYVVEPADLENPNCIWSLQMLTENYKGKSKNIIGGDWFSGNYWYDYGNVGTAGTGLGDYDYKSPGRSYDPMPLTNDDETFTFVSNDYLYTPRGLQIAISEDLSTSIIYPAAGNGVGTADVDYEGNIGGVTFDDEGSIYEDICYFHDTVPLYIIAADNFLYSYNKTSIHKTGESNGYDSVCADDKYIYAASDEGICVYSYDYGGMGFTSVYTYNTGDAYDDITTDGVYVYAVSTHGLDVFDFNETESELYKIDRYSGGSFKYVHVDNNYTYVSNDTNIDVFTFDGSELDKDNQFGGSEMSDVTEFLVSNRYVFVASYNSVLAYDKSDFSLLDNRTAPVSTQDDGYLAYDGRYLFLARTSGVPSVNIMVYSGFCDKEPFPIGAYPRNSVMNSSVIECSVGWRDYDMYYDETPDDNMNMTICFYTNESGTWQFQQKNQTNNRTERFYWDFSIENKTRHWWNVTVDDGYWNRTYSYNFTTYDFNGSGTESDPYQITDWKKLHMIRYYKDANFSLENNLNKSSTWYNTYATDWTPIANDYDYRFTGTFHGNNYTISDYLVVTDCSYPSLFGKVEGKIEYLNLYNVTINEGGGTASALCDMFDSGTIVRYCTIDTITINDATEYVGGLVSGVSGTLSYCEAYNVDISAEEAGGLAGFVYNDGVITNSSATNVSIVSESLSGGLTSQTQGYIETSYSKNVTVEGRYNIGGFVGCIMNTAMSDGEVRECYSVDSDITRVSGYTSDSFGGFVGDNYQGIVVNCFTNNSVYYDGTGDPTSNGFCGEIDNSGDYEDSGNFFDADESNQDTSAGNATPKTTNEMKTLSTFSGWDMNYTNVDLNDGYPYLSWQNESDEAVWLINGSPVPTVTINFAGNLGDEGGPYWNPTEGDGETTQLTGTWLNGYYTNSSLQKEDWIYINCTITDASTVKLHWLNETSWDNSTSLTNTGGNYWEVNTSGNISTSSGFNYSFDIFAESASGNVTEEWDKHGYNDEKTRRYVSLNNTPDNSSIDYQALYLHTATYSDSEEGDYDSLIRDQGPDGTTTDTGWATTEPLTDTAEILYCSSFTNYWLNEPVCLDDFEVKNIYYHFWWKNFYDGWSGGSYAGTYRSREQAFYNESNTFYPMTEAISQFSYDNEDYNLSANFYNMSGDSWDWTFTDNSIYEFIPFFTYTAQPGIFANRSYQSFVILNVPDNGTLKVTDSDSDGMSDYDELWVNYTNPFESDTDGDGVDDATEIDSGTDPNDYTDYPVLDDGPMLTQDSCEPTSGVASYTVFHFNVTWTDTEDTPDDGYLVVNISRDGWYDNSSMSYVSGDNTTGAVYTYSTSLSASSSYNYTFYAYDGTNYNSSGPHDNPDVESQSLSFTITTSSDGDFFFKDWTLDLTGVGLTTQYNVSEDNQTGVLPALNITNTGNVPLNFSINWSSEPGSGIIAKWNTTDNAPIHGTNTVAEDPSSTQIITDLQPMSSEEIWLWMDFTNVQAQESSANIQIVSWT
jgi:hypothetical protein